MHTGAEFEMLSLTAKSRSETIDLRKFIGPMRFCTRRTVKVLKHSGSVRKGWFIFQVTRSSCCAQVVSLLIWGIMILLMNISLALTTLYFREISFREPTYIKPAILCVCWFWPASYANF